MSTFTNGHSRNNATNNMLEIPLKSSKVLTTSRKLLERFRIAFTANDKLEIRVYVFLKKNGYFSEKLKTANGKYRVNIVTWSFLPFAVCRLNAVLYLSTVKSHAYVWSPLSSTSLPGPFP